MRINAKYILLIILALAITKTALSGESYRGQYKLTYGHTYDGQKNRTSFTIEDTKANRALMEVVDESNINSYLPLACWLESDVPCVAIASLSLIHI